MKRVLLVGMFLLAATITIAPTASAICHPNYLSCPSGIVEEVKDHIPMAWPALVVLLTLVVATGGYLVLRRR